MFKVECKNDYNSKFEQSFRVKKVCMDEKVIEIFSDVEIKSLVISYLFLLTPYPIFFFNCNIISIGYNFQDLYSANEEESKVNERTNQISSDSIAEVVEDYNLTYFVKLCIC